MESPVFQNLFLSGSFFWKVSGLTLPSPYFLGPVLGVSELCLSLLKRSKSDALSKDRSSFWLLWAVNLAGIGAGIYLAFHWVAWALPCREQVYIAGFCLFSTGLILRWHSIIHLGRSFTVNVAIAPDQRLIQTGPYQFVRHPGYAGSLMLNLGFGLCVGNLASLLAIVLPCFCVTLWRIHIEEEALIQAFGQRYQDYRQRTRRLVPFVY